MPGFIQDIEKITIHNDNFRKVIYTAMHCQLVLMSLKPGEDIGLETHDQDQFFRIEQGHGRVVLDGVPTDVFKGFAMLVPAGSTHNVINHSDMPLKLFTIYAPPHHRDAVTHPLKLNARQDPEQFDGVTTGVAN